MYSSNRLRKHSYDDFDYIHHFQYAANEDYGWKKEYNSVQYVVVKEGKILEEGNHKELMKQKGEYEKMFSAQAEKYNMQ